MSRVSKVSPLADSIRAMAERVLSTRELNRALLARQHLLEPSRQSLTQTLERVSGLQTQYAPSGYIGIWSRLEGFHRPALPPSSKSRPWDSRSLGRDPKGCCRASRGLGPLCPADTGGVSAGAEVGRGTRHGPKYLAHFHLYRPSAGEKLTARTQIG